ncbi:MAG: phage tail length tape measure family protein [Rhizobiaceae bacterium]|nr:phage tail length tape measure family protein [Rhizobiaceae bacterium]
MTVKLSALRVSADMDAAGFTAGARSLEQSSARAGAAVTGLGQTVQQTDTKVSQAGNGIHRLSLQYVEGYASQAKYEQGLRRINAALETGQISAAQAQILIAGMTQKLAFAGNAAELAARGHTQLAGIVSTVNRNLEVETGQIDLNTAALVRNSKAAKAAQAANDNAASFRRRNLTYQLFDVGQMAALGQNPAMLLMQQGPQIAQIYAGQGGVNAAFKDLSSILGGIATKFGPIALGAAVVAGGIAMLRSEIEDATGVAVSFTDVALAMVQVPGRAIYDYLQPAIAEIAPWFEAAWDLAISAFSSFVNNTIAAFGVTYQTIKLGAANIGPLFVAAGEAAANGFIAGINWMVRKTIEGINAIISSIKGFADLVGADKAAEWFGFDLSKVGLDPDKFKLDPIDIDGKDTLAELTKNWEEYQKTVEDIVGKDYAKAIFDAIAGQAAQNARDRIAGTEEALKKAAAAAAELKRQFDAFEGRADNLLEQYFPGEAARREAEELIGLLDRFGEKLDGFQRAAVEARIDELFLASALGVRDLGKETDKTADKFGKLKDKGKEAAEALKDGFAGFLEDLFTGRDLLESLVSLGARLASMNFDNVAEGLSNWMGGKGFALDAPSTKTNIPAARATGQEIGKAIVPVIQQAAEGPAWERQGRGGTPGMPAAIQTGKAMAQGVVPVLERGIDAGLQTYAAAIRKIESGSYAGNYGAMGRVITNPNSRYYGDRAYGAYQVMGGNIPAWTQEVLGTSMSIKQFLGDQSAQDKVFYAKFGQSLQKFGNAADAVSVHFTGKPVAAAGNVNDGSNTNAQYISKFNAAMSGLPDAVRTGATVGTAKGAQEGTFDAWAGLREVSTGKQGASGGVGSGFGQTALGLLSAGLGGFSTGYQSASPLMGALGGAVQGFGAGMQMTAVLGSIAGPIGAVVGGIAGLIGGLMGARAKLKAAKRELEKQMNAINNLLAVGEGRGIGVLQKQLSDYLGEIDKAVSLAWKAKNFDLVDRLHQSWNAMFLRLRRDFYDALPGQLEAYSSGYGTDSPLYQGSKAMRDLREELRTMLADVAYFTEETINKIDRASVSAEEAARLEAELREMGDRDMAAATEAAKRMILAFIGGRQEFTEYESAVQAVQGAVKAAQTALEELGMSAFAAAEALDKQLNAALKKLQSAFIDDISASLYELSDLGYFNDLLDAQKRYNDRLRDAAALGLSADLANRELALSLRSIVKEAKLTDDQIRQLAAAMPELSASLMGLIGMGEGGDTAQALADAQAKVEDAKAALRSAYEKERSEIESTISRLKSFTEGIRNFRDSLKLDKQLSPYSPYERLMEAQRQFNEVSAKALAGDETAQGRLEEVSRAYLEEARSYYASSEAYFQIFEQVDATLEQALAKASSQLSAAEKQLSALEKQVGKLIDIDDGVKSVSAAIADLKAAQAAEASAQAADDAYKNTVFQEMLAVLKAQLAAQSAAAAAQQTASTASTANYSSTDPVANLYRSILKREPDPVGYAFYSGNLNAGLTTLAGIEADLKKHAAGMASGGWVTGGVPGMDSVLKRLMPGEFVMPAAQAQRYRPEIEAMRGGWYAANDNSAVVKAIQAMQRQLTDVMQRMIQMEAMAGRETVAATMEAVTALREQGRNAEFRSRQKKAA